MTLAHGPFVVGVESDDPAPLRWLQEFLTPSFARVAGPPSRRVSLRIDPLGHGRRSARRGQPDAAGPTDAGDVACFVLDSRVVRHQLLMDDDERRWIADRELGVLYGVDRPARDVTVVARRDGPEARVALMRVVRELAMIDVRQRGGLLLHASVAVSDGSAAAFMGPKRAGKTSTLVHALRAPGARYLANDRVAVGTSADGTWHVRGIPSIVALRAGTIGLFPELAERLRTSASSHGQTMDEVRTRPQRAPWGSAQDGADVSPPQFAELCGRELVDEAPLRAIVFPTVERACRGLVVRPLSPEAAFPLLLASRLAAMLPVAVPEAFLPPDVDPASPVADLRGTDTEETVRHLSRDVPCYRATLGTGAFAGPVGRFWPAVLHGAPVTR